LNDPSKAGLLLVKRRKMRESLIAYAQGIDIPSVPVKEDGDIEDFDRALTEGGSVRTGVAAHHIILMNKLQETMLKPYGRLMVFMPPGSAKSTYVDVVAPTWFMGKFPGSRIILASYGSDLAKKHGTKARAVVKQDMYMGTFNTTISKDTGAREMWALENESEYMAGGLLSGLTGNRAIGVIIDDPIKGRAEAESKTVRDKVYAAFEDDLRTRFLPKAWMILIQTRWHDEDLGGRLLPEDYDGASGPIQCRDGMVWDVLNIPAKCERQDDPLGRNVGEYLWPEWFDAMHWYQYEPRPGDPDSPNERTWAALYQQKPRPDHGNQWEREWVNWYKVGEHPTYLNVYCSSDYAVSDGEGDYTEHGIGGLDRDGELWLLDWWYGQSPPDVTIDALLMMCKRWNCKRGFNEKGIIQKAIEPLFKQRQRQLGINVKIEYLPSIGDKIARFQNFRGMGSSGKVHVPDCPWGHRLVDQLCVFPGRSLDDAVDVCSGFGRGLEGMVWSKVMAIPEEKKKGLVFGSWEWLTHGTENMDHDKPRIF